METTGESGNENTCPSAVQKITPYQQLALQLFGKPVDSQKSSADYFYKGPVVHLNMEERQTRAKTRKVERTSVHCEEREENVRKTVQCLICYSEIHLTLCHPSNQNDEQTPGSSSNKEASCSDFLEFIRILTSQQKRTDFSIQSRFQEALSCLSESGSLRTLCDVCNAACEQILLKQRTLLKLQQQIGELQLKFVAAIQASTELAQQELSDPLSTGGEDEDGDLTRVRRHRENVNVVRKCLLSRSTKARRKRKSPEESLLFCSTSNEQSEEKPVEGDTLEGYDDWHSGGGEELFDTHHFDFISEPVEVKIRVEEDADYIPASNEDALSSDDSVAGNTQSGDEDSTWEPPSSPEIRTTSLSSRRKRKSLSSSVKKGTGEKRKRRRGEVVRTSSANADSDKPFPCVHCGASFDKKYGLVRHLHIHSDLKPFACDHCEETFETYSDLKLHLTASHLGERSHTCNLCQKAYYTRKILYLHMKSKHPEEAKRMREETAAANNAMVRVKKKRVKKKAEKRVPCEHCDKMFVSKSHVEMHMRTHTGERPYVCDICSKAFALKKTLELHVLATHEGIRPHVCEQCGRGFTRKAHLSMHYMIQHATVKPFVCEHCGKAFSIKSYLAEHVKSHLGIKSAACHLCPKTFFQTRSLNEHLQKQHPGEVEYKEIKKKKKAEKRFPCEHCSKMFVSPTALANHVRTHTGERPFPCSFCSRRFTEKKTMQRHEIVAHGVAKPHVCEQCGREFARKDYLATHHKIVHANVKPYSCDRCEKSFGTKSHLEKHIRSHLGHRPHSCHLCGKAYYQRNNLNLHLQKHHPEAVISQNSEYLTPKPEPQPKI